MKKILLPFLMSILLIQPFSAITADQALRGRNIFGISLAVGVLSSYFLDTEKLYPYGKEGLYTRRDGSWSDWGPLPREVTDSRRVYHQQKELVEKFCYTFCGLYAFKFGIKGFNKMRSFVQRLRS